MPAILERLGLGLRRRLATWARLDESAQRNVAGLFAGLILGTTVVWLLATAANWIAIVWLSAGSFLLSSIYRRVVGLGGLALALFFWMEATASRLAVDGPMPAGSIGPTLGDAAAIFLVLVACLVAAAAYLACLPFRGRTTRLSTWRPLPRLTVATGLVAAAALCVSMISIAPAGASFGVTLPSGWSSITRIHSKYAWADPIYCDSYMAWLGTEVLTGSDPAVPSQPTLCAAVVDYPYDLIQPYGAYSGSHACYYVMANGDGSEGALSDWPLQSTPTKPAISGAYEEVRSDKLGNRIYGFGLERWRFVGPFSEHLCYVVALTVPHGSGMSEAEANTILSTFSFR
jgi:hypothetical protein